MKKEDIKVGAILTARWGWNCCRYSFYKVVRMTESTVWLREIGKTYVSGAPNSPCATVIPDPSREALTDVRRKIKVYSPGQKDEWCCVSVGSYKSCHGVYREGSTYAECCD